MSKKVQELEEEIDEKLKEFGLTTKDLNFSKDILIQIEQKVFFKIQNENEDLDVKVKS